MNPVSATLIVRDDRHVLETIAQLRPHVAEILIGHTPCEEMKPAELYDAGADLVLHIPGVEDGRLMDWSAARNRMLDAANERWILWADSDDEIVGLERLPEALEMLAVHPLGRLLCPYEYAIDSASGRCEHRQYRERIVRNDGRFEWRYPCHEVLVAKDGKYGGIEPHFDGLVWRHHRVEQPAENGRQYLMLKAYEAEHPDDPWVLLNLGLDRRRTQKHAEGAAYLERYVAASGWDDEKCFAMLQLADAWQTIGGFVDDAKAMHWARAAAELKPGEFAPLYALAKLWYLRHELRGEPGALEQARAMCEQAREAPERYTPLAVRPQDRAWHVHDLERQCCEEAQDWVGAMGATERALASRPDDAAMRVKRLKYEAALRLETADWVDGMRQVIPPVAPSSGISVVFACGPSWRPWSPAVLEEEGLGGSETAVVEMAKRLAKRGHRVRVYCTCETPGIFDSVTYLDASSPAPADVDVLIAWRNAQLVGFAPARARLLWVHDVEASYMGPQWWVRADRVLALSDWHRRNLIDKHKLADSQVVQTRNGIDLARFAEALPRDEKQIIWSSSLDRGLQVLLDVWPEIRQRVPEARLGVYYGAATWEAVAEQSGSQQQRYTVTSLLRRLKSTRGVTYHGQVDQKTLARAMLGAGVWVGSLWFPETHCIGACEATAAGLRMVAGANAALPETIGERGVLLEGDWLHPRYQERLVDAVVRAATLPDGEGTWPRRAVLQEYARQHFSWDEVADAWCEMFTRVIAEADGGAMPEFRRMSA